MRGRAEPDRTKPPSKRSDYWGVVLGTSDPRALARFYAEILGWRIVKDEPGWVTIYPDEGVAYVAFQYEKNQQRPAWPEVDEQQMRMHLDVEVEDLDTAVEHAIELGASMPDHQPQDNVRVLVDPAGHPFCLYSG